MEVKVGGHARAMAFLSGAGKDGGGRTLNDYFGFAPDDWEFKHDVIQWAFPTKTASEFNADAPVIDENFSAYNHDHLSVDELQFMRYSIKTLLVQYLDSIGIKYNRDIGDLITPVFKIDRALDFTGFRLHNVRRFSRILECLRIFRMETLSKDFYEFLVLEFAPQNPTVVDGKTIAYWYASWQNKAVRA